MKTKGERELQLEKIVNAWNHMPDKDKFFQICNMFSDAEINQIVGEKLYNEHNEEAMEILADYVCRRSNEISKQFDKKWLSFFMSCFDNKELLDRYILEYEV